MNRKKLVDAIIEALGILKHKINTYNQAGLFDINSFSEDFFQKLLNITLDLNLVNINTLEKKNFPAIDLGDDQQKIAIQVTSNTSKAKINETIRLFLEKKHYEKYNHLQIFILKGKTRFKDNEFDTENKFTFNYIKDILDIDDLVTIIRTKDISRLEAINKFLNEELVDRNEKHQTQTIAREVETIMDLIQLLSNYPKASDGINNVNIDPERKIYKRFRDYSEFLVKEIQELIPKYANARQEAIDKIGLDTVKAKHITIYLRAKSDSVLIECNGNPKLALVNLTNYFDGKLGENGKDYEYNAIRYYLIQEIINCNVFPNDTIMT